MLQSLSDLFTLARARLSMDASTNGFEVEEARDPIARRRLFDHLQSHARLAGQFHALSRDAWRLLWTPGRRACVAFHDRRFALVAWRDPIAVDDDAALDALHLFRAYASSMGKHAVVLGASERLRARSPQLGSLWIGGEQSFDLRRFDLRGKKGEKLRLAINHARRVGAVAKEIHPLADERDRARLCAVEEAWKRARPARRTPSFLRTEPMENAEHRRFFAVETPDGDGAAMQAFLVCSPVSRRGFYLQDLVRHPSSPRGVSELVTVHALQTFAREGIEHATAGIVPFFDPDRARARHSLSVGVDWAVSYFDRLYRFAGLKQFRAKFAMARVESIHVLHWPRVLTPLAVWDIVALLSGK